MDNLGFGTTQLGVKSDSAWVDTGASNMIGPREVVKKLHEIIPGSASSDEEHYTVPCSTQESVTFTFSGVTWKLAPKNWINMGSRNRQGRCLSNIAGSAFDLGNWLLGAAFIKNVYTVFDADNARIGKFLSYAARKYSN